MRYKNEIFQLKDKLTADMNNRKRHKGDRWFADTSELDDESVSEMLYTVTWLNKFNSSNNSIVLEELKDMKIPSKESIINLMEHMREWSTRTRAFAKGYKGVNPELYKSLDKMGFKQYQCSRYYTELANEGFFNKISPYKFNERELKEWEEQKKEDRAEK